MYARYFGSNVLWRRVPSGLLRLCTAEHVRSRDGGTSTPRERAVSAVPPSSAFRSARIRARAAANVTYKPTYFQPPASPGAAPVRRAAVARRANAATQFQCCDCVQIPCLHRKHQCRHSLSLRLLLPWRPRSRPRYCGI